MDKYCNFVYCLGSNVRRVCLWIRRFWDTSLFLSILCCTRYGTPWSIKLKFLHNFWNKQTKISYFGWTVSSVRYEFLSKCWKIIFRNVRRADCFFPLLSFSFTFYSISHWIEYVYEVLNWLCKAYFVKFIII